MNSSNQVNFLPRILNTNVIVCALGYFVDIYDLVLFSILRVPSLKALGFEGNELMEKGILLINLQMAGMLLGGILWGVLGDKAGRIAVLFGSILLYSIANIANAFVTNIEAYAVLRFLAGVGLAGELGAAMTLVSETMDKHRRGYGAAIVASIGILGAVVGALIGDYFSWQTAYIVGGVMGLCLLFLRFKMYDSGLFSLLKDSSIRRGNFLMMFQNMDRLTRYIKCILIGLPIWFVVGILVTFSPELARALGVTGEVSAGTAIMACYAGLSVGDLCSGLLSQRLRSRRKAIGFFLAMTIVCVGIYPFLHGLSPLQYYIECSILGFSIGFWAVFMMISTELFGTNLRATASTTAPNFVRGSVVPMSLILQWLTPIYGILMSAMTIGFVVLTVSVLALWKTRETYGSDLDFIESDDETLTIEA